MARARLETVMALTYAGMWRGAGGWRWQQRPHHVVYLALVNDFMLLDDSFPRCCTKVGGEWPLRNYGEPSMPTSTASWRQMAGRIGLREEGRTKMSTR